MIAHDLSAVKEGASLRLIGYPSEYTETGQKSNEVLDILPALASLE